MTEASTYAIRDRDLEAILALGARPPLIIGTGGLRGPGAMFSCNRRWDIWAPDRRGYTDPDRRIYLHGRSADLDRIARRVRRQRWKGGRFIVHPSGVYMPADAGGLDRIIKFTITITPIPRARKPRRALRCAPSKPSGRALAPKKNLRTATASTPTYRIAEGPDIRLCVFCFSADLDVSGCRACGRGNGGYGLKW